MLVGDKDGYVLIAVLIEAVKESGARTDHAPRHIALDSNGTVRKLLCGTKRHHCLPYAERWS
jgi:hypothetical protein